MSRVPAERVWLYVVKGLHTDDYIHLRFVPRNTEVVFANGTGVVLRVFIGEEARANAAGLVEDFPVPLMPGTYNVTLRVYVPTTETVTVTSQDLRHPIVIPLANTSVPVRSPNPAVFLEDLGAWLPAYLVDGEEERFAVVVPPHVPNARTLRARLVWNYPFPYAKPQLRYAYAKGAEVLGKVPIAGDVELRDGKLFVKGTVDLGALAGSTVILGVSSISGMFLNAESGAVVGNVVGKDGNYTGASYVSVYAGPTTRFSGTMVVKSVLILYDVRATLFSTSHVDTLPYVHGWPMEKISYVVAGNIVGAWSYRVPIYITLAELPQLLTETGFVFRIELPVAEWVRAGLLSPALEDLMIVDAGSRPLLFYVYRIKGDGRAVVYFRYDAAITGNTLVVYVLLRNTQLWGTGRTFSTAAVFDLVNPREFTDDFGYDVFYTYLTYNAVLVTATDATRFKLGKTWFDFVYIDKSRLVEQHGSAELFNATLPSQLAGDDEVLIYVSRDDYDDVLIFRNAQPLTSFKLSEFRSGPAYYVGYSNAKEVYAFRMLMYSYTVGQLVGGFQSPPQVVKTPATVAAPQAQVDWWSLFLMVFAIIMVSVAVKWLSEGAGGGERKPLRLP